MRYMLWFLSLWLAVAAIAPRPTVASDGYLDIVFVQWVPGDPPFRTDAPDVFAPDQDILERYRIGGRVTRVASMRVESPSGLPARMVVLLWRPIPRERGEIRLPLPISDTVYWQQEAQEPCWTTFPTDRWSFQDVVRLSADQNPKAGASDRIVYRLAGANGAEYTGTAAEWSASDAPVSTTAQPN